VVTGSVTIPGRPEMRLGYPIYMEHRDSFHYVRSINHSFDYGGSFTTTLSLQTERRKVWYEDETERKWKLHIDKVYRFKEAIKTPEPPKPKNTKTKEPKKKDTAPKRPCKVLDAEQGPPTLEVTDKVEKDQMKLYEGQRRIVSMKQGRYELTPRNDHTLSVNLRKTSTGNPANRGRDERVVTVTTTPYTDDQGYQVFGAFPYGRSLNPVLIAPRLSDSDSNTQLPVLKEVYLTVMARPLFDHESRNMNLLFFEDKEGAAPLYLDTENKMPQVLGMIADTSSENPCIDPNQNENKANKNAKNPQKDAAVTEATTKATVSNDGRPTTEKNALVNSVGEDHEIDTTIFKTAQVDHFNVATGYPASPDTIPPDADLLGAGGIDEIAELERQLEELEGGT